MMLTYTKLIEALTILAKHEPEKMKDHLAGCEAVIHAGPLGFETIPEEDRKRLLDLGWQWDKQYDRWKIYTY
jgi:hypothetical protein